MAGETDLSLMLATLEPRLRDGPVVFALAPDGVVVDGALATILEDEGRTVVVERDLADDLGLSYEFVGAWVTLSVHSALDAVGLTAAVSAALTDAGISCNVLAAFFHDHLVVPWDRRDDALDVLRALRSEHERE